MKTNRMFNAKQTILLPFTKEYRAQGTQSGISQIFLRNENGNIAKIAKELEYIYSAFYNNLYNLGSRSLKAKQLKEVVFNSI